MTVVLYLPRISVSFSLKRGQLEQVIVQLGPGVRDLALQFPYLTADLEQGIFPVFHHTFPGFT